MEMREVDPRNLFGTEEWVAVVVTEESSEVAIVGVLGD